MNWLLILALWLPSAARAQTYVEGWTPSGGGIAAPGGGQKTPSFGDRGFSGGTEGASLGTSRAGAVFRRAGFAADLKEVRTAALQPRLLYPEIGVVLKDNVRVEGSRAVGGKQNDFAIDYRDADLFNGIVAPARAIGSSGAPLWDKVRAIQELVNAAIPRDGLKNRKYHELNAAAMANENISLGSYVRARTGVCRENAMLTALALHEAGLTARFAYFGVYDDKGEYDEDHGTALLDVDGVTYIVDSFRPYGRYYNGHRLADLLRPPEDGAYSFASPLADANDRSPGSWRLSPQPFPRVGPLDRS